MKSTYFSLLFACILSILLFSQIQEFLFKQGASWYWSHFTPYLLCGLGSLLGCLILFFVKIRKAVKVAGLILLLSTPIILLTLHPIYAGDFTNSSSNVIVKRLPSNERDLKDGLTMISLANCDYCYKALQELKIIKNRVPTVDISVAVLTTNKAVIDYYNKETDSLFNLFMIDQKYLESWSELSPNQQFPCFLYLRDKKIHKKWSNQEFGYAAKDFVENH